MKTIELSTAKQSLSEVADEIDQDMIILTSHHKPIAAIISLKEMDEESLSLSTNHEFMNIIQQSRKEFMAGKRIPLEKMKQEILEMEL
ncbi:MAG: type II toxin-antitoxin system prevent-host-death family antitoxin [Candidatus Omnitrophota bacterium]|jgi:prevent-host-death family protein|nr:MAG: type II toxin-antitoxin system prevent-host-death family antitoxin [Candidatus Omnitrophota bacterium]